MPTELEDAIKDSTKVINIALNDEDGAAATPTLAKWKLTDEKGTVINSRSEVTISPLSESMDVVLKGPDLSFQATENDIAYRRFIVWGTYNSDLGAGLPFYGSATFKVVDPAAS